MSPSKSYQQRTKNMLKEFHLSKSQYKTIFNNPKHIAHLIYNYYCLKKASGSNRVV